MITIEIKHMENNSLIQHNGAYLKCVITSNDPSKLNKISFEPKGSLVVYNNEDNNNQKEIYLGSTFLASGYGWKSKEEFDIAQNIINDHGTNINQAKEDIDNIYNLISELNLDNKVNIELRPKNNNSNELDYEKSDISNTYLSFNDVNGRIQYIKLKDFLTNIRAATYNKLQIIDIQKCVIIDSNTVNINSINSKYNPTYTEDNSGILVSMYSDDIFKLPIGAKINQFKIKIKFFKKDTGGVEETIFKYFYQEYNNSTNKFEQKYTNNAIQSTIEEIVSNDETNEIYNPNNEDIYVITINGTYNNTLKYFILPLNEDQEYQELINNIYLNIKGTSNNQIKYYTYNDNVEINISDSFSQVKSYENIIKDYQEKLNINILIKGQYGYMFSEGSKDNIPTNYNIINDDNKIVENINSTNYAIFLIPICFTINECYLLKSSGTNYINYNIKGFVEKSSIYYKNIDLDNNHKLYIKYYSYAINLNEIKNHVGNLGSDKIYISLVPNNEQDVVQYGEKSNSSFSWSKLVDENFDSLYWITSNDWTNNNVNKSQYYSN